jgi:putative ABC transport system permease protein
VRSRVPLAWLQLKRDRLRFAIGVAGVGFAVTLIFMQFGFHRALFASAVRFHERLQADLVLVNPQAEMLARMKPFARRRLYQAAGFPGVVAVSPVYAAVAFWKNLDTRGSRAILVTAFDPTEDVLDLPAVTENLALLRYPDHVLFDEAARPEFGPIAAVWRDGGRIAAEVGRRRVIVAGMFPLGPSFGIDGTLITSDLNFLRIFPERERGLIDIGLIRLAPGADARAVQRALRAGLPPDVEVLTKQEYMAREQAYWGGTTPIGYVFTFGAIMGLVVGGIIVYQILFADIAGHLPEYATLKAMGYRDAYLFAVVLQEAVILAVLGFVPGLVACLYLYRLSEAATRLPMEMPLATGLLVLLLTVAMCCISAAIALRKVRAADPAEVF